MKRKATREHRSLWLFVVFGSLFVLPCGCSLWGPPVQETPAGDQLDAFGSAGPAQYVLDREILYKAIPEKRDYQVQIGDLLEFQMPAAVQIVTDALAESGTIEQTYLFSCRVSRDGTITLPIIGSVTVQGKTVLEIEDMIRNAYFPRYVVSPPAVVTQVKEYTTRYVSITGAVKNPGSYRLRADQMTLVSLLMEAGGIAESGATVIRISRPPQEGTDSPDDSGPILMPVKGLNIPFCDMALEAGSIVEVEGLDEHVFTVMGLVNHPGTFSYPPNAHFNLPQALAFSGGLNVTANPQYVHVYRPDGGGQVHDAVFSICPGPDFAETMAVKIKPGDVISVEHTPSTRRNLLLSDLLQLRATVGVAYTK